MHIYLSPSPTICYIEIAHKMMGTQFNAGETVEVIGADDGLVGSYHSAVVMKHKAELEFVKVHYDGLLNDNGGNLEEVVPSPPLRPLPPYECPASYKIGEHVDFLNRNGWWYAIVREKRGPNEYWVDFSGFGYDNMECEVEQLRPHLHWNGSHWVIPSRLNFVR